jgi:hypothetical protein
VMGKKSRNKGAAFERAIAIRLRKWLGDDWTVKRNPTDRQKGKAGAGEFEIVGPRVFPFAIECKAHESFEYSQLFKDPVSGPFLSFWEQATDQANSAEKKPMLFLKRNNGPVLVAMKSCEATAMLSVAEIGTMLRLYDIGCYVISADALFELRPSLLYEVT